jgi:hypothetical protein
MPHKGGASASMLRQRQPQAARGLVTGGSEQPEAITCDGKAGCSGQSVGRAFWQQIE